MNFESKYFLLTSLIVLLTVYIYIYNPINSNNQIKLNNNYENELDDDITELKEENDIEGLNYTICIVNIPGTKRIYFPKHKKLTYHYIEMNMFNPHNRFATIATHDVFFDYKIRKSRNDYTFEQYREDISLSSPFYLFRDEKNFGNCDYVYIPTIGTKPKHKNIRKFYSFINKIHNEYKGSCFYQTDISDNIRKSLTNGNNTFIPHFPNVSFRQFGGILLTPRRLYLTYEYGKFMYHLSRFDENLQIYCDIDYNKVVLSNKNIFGVEKQNCFDCF